MIFGSFNRPLFGLDSNEFVYWSWIFLFFLQKRNTWSPYFAGSWNPDSSSPRFQLFFSLFFLSSPDLNQYFWPSQMEGCSSEASTSLFSPSAAEFTDVSETFPVFSSPLLWGWWEIGRLTFLFYYFSLNIVSSVYIIYCGLHWNGALKLTHQYLCSHIWSLISVWWILNLLDGTSNYFAQFLSR